MGTPCFDIPWDYVNPDPSQAETVCCSLPRQIACHLLSKLPPSLGEGKPLPITGRLDRWQGVPVSKAGRSSVILQARVPHQERTP